MHDYRQNVESRPFVDMILNFNGLGVRDRSRVASGIWRFTERLPRFVEVLRKSTHRYIRVHSAKEEMRFQHVFVICTKSSQFSSTCELGRSEKRQFLQPAYVSWISYVIYFAVHARPVQAD